MKIGDKVVWNKHICGEFSNAFNLNGKTGTILRIYDGGFADVYFFDRGVQTVFKEDLQLVETNKTNNMKNLKELEKKYAELGKEIQALKENEIKYPIYFEVKYPIYCKNKYTGKITKFYSLTSGTVVKQDDIHNVGYKSNWAEHTNTAIWEQLEVDETTGFYDTQPVWCWDNNCSHMRMLKFYDSKNKRTFGYNGKRNSYFTYNNYLPFEGNWLDWMLEAHKTLEK